MSGDSKPISGPQLSVARAGADDPLDGSGAGDAPDGWYQPDRLGHPQEMPADTVRQTNTARIVDHLKSILSAARRDDA